MVNEPAKFSILRVYNYSEHWSFAGPASMLPGCPADFNCPVARLLPGARFPKCALVSYDCPAVRSTGVARLPERIRSPDYPETACCPAARFLIITGCPETEDCPVVRLGTSARLPGQVLLPGQSWS